MTQFNAEEFVRRYVEATSTAESEPEILFHMLIEQLIGPGTELTPQFDFETRRGRFRADFLMVTPPGERLVIEIDGKQFHDPVRDCFRDAFTLADGHANHIYRFTAETIFRHLWHAIYALYRHHPSALTDEAIHTIRDKASHFVSAEELHASSFAWIPDSILINSADAHPSWLAEVSHIEVRSGLNARGAPLFGREYIDFARDNPGKDIDWLTDQWKLRYAENRRSFESANWLFDNEGDDAWEDLWSS